MKQLIYLSGLLFILPIYAEDITALDTIVVTGTRTEKKLLDVPVRTEIITQTELQQQHANNLAEALEYLPGVLLKPTTKNGVEVWMQGFSGDRVLILIDGKPLTAATGSTIDLSQIAIIDIDHIEIVKGASSVLYGSSAMGGVINVITKQALQGLHGSIEAQMGTFGDKGSGSDPDEYSINSKISYMDSDWELEGYISLRQANGYDLDKDTFYEEGESYDRININTNFSYNINENTKVYLSPSYYKEDREYPFFSFTPGVGNIYKEKREEATRLRFLTGFTHENQYQGILDSSILYEDFQDTSDQDVLVTSDLDLRRKADITLIQWELNYTQPFGDNHIVTTGLNLKQNQLQQTQITTQSTIEEIEDASSDSYEVFLQDDIFLSEKTEFIWGVRSQYDSDFGFFTAPKISFLYQPKRTETEQINLRISTGLGYRAPNLKERYYYFDHSSLGYIIIGNPDLKPEKSFSIQMGVEWIHRRFHIEANLFYNNIDDLITTALNTSKSAQQNLQIFDYQNLNKASTQGLELSFSQNITTTLKLNLAYTYLKAKDLDNHTYLTQRPEHQFKGGINWHIPHWRSHLDIYLVAQSKEYLDINNTITSPAWTRWDIRLNTKINKKLTFIAGVENVFDQVANPQDDNDLSPTRGQFIYSGLKFEF